MCKKINPETVRKINDQVDRAEEMIENLENGLADEIYEDVYIDFSAHKLYRAATGSNSRFFRLIDIKTFKNMDENYPFYDLDDVCKAKTEELNHLHTKDESIMVRLVESVKSVDDLSSRIGQANEEIDSSWEEIRRMIRPIIEKSNAARKINPKKAYSGYIVLKISFPHHPDGMCETRIETPYPITFPINLIRQIIIHDMRVKIFPVLGIVNDYFDSPRKADCLTSQDMADNTLYFYSIDANRNQKNGLLEITICTTQEVNHFYDPIPNPKTIKSGGTT